LKYSRVIGSAAACLAVLFGNGCANRSDTSSEVQAIYVEPEAEVVQPQLDAETETEPMVVVEAIEMADVEEPPVEERAVSAPQRPQADRGDILWIQERLKDLGYYEGSIDGSVGGATRRAIEVYQSDQGIEVDGRPSAELREFMWRNGG
jgi:hypothetical protein